VIGNVFERGHSDTDETKTVLIRFGARDESQNRSSEGEARKGRSQKSWPSQGLRLFESALRRKIGQLSVLEFG
jgi:hypothetical protein